MATFGKNILENLTTGMYYDSKVIYREYIQNACDQIDKAARDGLFKNANEGTVDIEIDSKKRCITITDNATGIPTSSFRRQLEDIANSDKDLGVDKGFRGIGRLCGLAYCKTLTFRATAIGEPVRSIMTMDAKKMRDMISSPEKFTVDQILEQITRFSTEKAPVDEHGFEVCLEDVNKENTALLNKDEVLGYLSFVAPVPYSNKFRLRHSIYEHAKQLGSPIDEYRIYVNGNQIFKEYGMKLYSRNNDGPRQAFDELQDVQFYDIYKGSELIAWMWYGLCRFVKAIPKQENPMFGFRVRRGNIQVGDNTVLAKFFKEDRGNSYFVGEVFAVSRELIPNSRRDNFNENETRNFFEDKLKEYCYQTLHRIYNEAAKTRSSFARIAEYTSAVEDLSNKTSSGFVDDKEREALERKVQEKEKAKEEAKKKIAKIPDANEKTDDPVVIVQKAIKEHYDRKETERKAEQAEKKRIELLDSTPKTKYFTDSLSKLDKSKRKLVAQVIGIVSKHVDESTLNDIKTEIEKAFR